MNNDKAKQIIKDRIKQITQATNKQELRDFEWFAHGAAVTMWELEIFTQQEHTQNYDQIIAVVNKRMNELK